MSKFVFDLQSVLDQRRQAEETAQCELARLLREHMILQTQLRTLRDTVWQDKASLAGALVGSVDLGRVQRHAALAGQAHSRSSQIIARIAALEGQMVSTRRRLVEAAKRRQAIERLREKQHQRWQTAQRRRHDNELDDIVTISHVRRLLGLATE